jgi:hypothetical protein
VTSTNSASNDNGLADADITNINISLSSSDSFGQLLVSSLTIYSHWCEVCLEADPTAPPYAPRTEDLSAYQLWAWGVLPGVDISSRQCTLAFSEGGHNFCAVDDDGAIYFLDELEGAMRSRRIITACTLAMRWRSF